MQTTLRILKVFLASPSDVKPERAAAEKLVNDMNKLVREFGWQILLYMWEDEVPAFGRPQETINANVDECAVFVGLLWEKWGTRTGAYSSGFEEEFERALARRKANGEPEIWLLFKAVDPDKVKDPGPQLSKVLEFRNKQGSVQEVFYNDVADRDEWKSKLSNWLWLYVTQRAIAASGTPQPQQPASTPEPAPSETTASHSIDASMGKIDVPQQLLASSKSLANAIKNGELLAVRSETGSLQDFDVARLFLLSASMMFRWYTGGIIQTHEINLIYQHRERLKPVPIERLQLLRAVVADGSDVVPGWFWFGGMTLENVREQLLVLAEQDSSNDVRRRALWLLREARIPLPEEMWLTLPLWDDDDSVRAGAYNYLATIADETVLPLLDDLSTTEDASISSSAREAKFAALMRFKPEDAFSEMLETGKYASDAKLGQLSERASEINDAALLKGAESQWAQVRQFAVKELARRGGLSKEISEKLTADSSVPIREIAFTELAKAGNPIDFEMVKKALATEKPETNSFAALLGGQKPEEGDASCVILAYYRAQKAELVTAAVEWFGLDGELAYRSLATDHFEAIRGDLRADLENGFERVKKQSIDQVESTMGTEYAQKLVERFKKYDDFIHSQFVEAALSGLAIHGEVSDIRFGRQYLASDRTKTQLAAVRIVCRFGSPDDVPALLEVTKDSWGEARDEAGACALRLSPTPFAVANELIHAKSEELAGLGYAWLYAQRTQEVSDFFQILLDSEDEKERLRAVYYLSKTRTTEELEKVLEATLYKEKYYYNVVTWLDRLLHSPESLKEFFVKKLAEEAR
jgi:SOS response regulatory protein OraA/RecX